MLDGLRPTNLPDANSPNDLVGVNIFVEAEEELTLRPRLAPETAASVVTPIASEAVAINVWIEAEEPAHPFQVRQPLAGA